VSSRSLSSDGVNFVVFLLFVSLYWTAAVIKNVAHATVCGVVGNYFYFNDYNDRTARKQAAPSLAALGNALSYGFGSICFGSLITALLRALRAMLAYATRHAEERSTLSRILECLLRELDAWVERLNSYGILYVMLSNKPFREASSYAWTLIKARGFDLIISDNIVTQCMVLVALLSAALTALLATLLAKFLLVERYWAIFALMGATYGFVISLVLLEVLRSAALALLICYAEDPDALRTTKFDVYLKLSTAIRGRVTVSSTQPPAPQAEEQE
jgi:hypothetical protein